MNFLVETEITCPICCETFVSTIDTSQGDLDMIEDCTVCCRPIRLIVSCEPGEIENLQIEPA